MENAKFEMLSSVEEDDCIMKLVEEHGVRESALILKFKQRDLINRVSIYVNKTKPRIKSLEEKLFYEPPQEDADGSDLKEITVPDVQKTLVNTDEELTSTEKEASESEFSKNGNEESTCSENEDDEEKDEETVADVEKNVVNTHEESTSSEKEDGDQLESSKTSDEESTFTESEDKEGEQEKLMDSVEESTSTVISSPVMSLREIMLQQAMSAEENETDLKTLTKKEGGGVPRTGSAAAAGMQQVVGRGFGRGRVFARDGVNAGQGGFGRGHYVRKLQQKQSLEDASSSEVPVPAVHGFLSMYMENAKIRRTGKHKR